MDANERLRAWLEQRREMGESEFVLDSMSVEEALKVLGAKPAARPAAAAPARATQTSRRSGPPEGPAQDWRTALADLEPSKLAAPTKSASPAKSLQPPPVETVPPEPVAETPEPTVRLPLIVQPPSDGRLSHCRTLDEVAREIASCTSCSLSATALNPVPGEGSPTAQFVCVGEAPGANEDELGRPFVGRSGDLLTKILDAIGFKREDIFICNVLKHRPPGNRNPTSEEIVACRHFLLRQLEILQPRVILALGTFAAQTLLDTKIPIGQLREVVHRYHGIPLVATYHPAALLRNPHWKRPAWEDVKLARRIFDNAESGV